MISTLGRTSHASSSDLETRLSELFNDKDFYIIHEKMSPFNLFEAVGAIRGELRHSNFLAYLLSPNRPHGLRTRPLATMLREFLNRIPTPDRPIMILEVIAGELDDAIVYRERYNIDILVELPSLKLILAIENKIGANAPDGQLEGYRRQLELEFPGHRKLFVFLTPEGIAPNDKRYLAYSYSEHRRCLPILDR